MNIIQLLESPIPLSVCLSVTKKRSTGIIHQRALSGWWSEFSLQLINRDDDHDDFSSNESKMHCCVGHTAWAPEGREGRYHAGPKGRNLEVEARRAPRLLVPDIVTGEKQACRLDDIWWISCLSFPKKNRLSKPSWELNLLAMTHQFSRNSIFRLQTSSGFLAPFPDWGLLLRTSQSPSGGSAVM